VKEPTKDTWRGRFKVHPESQIKATQTTYDSAFTTAVLDLKVSDLDALLFTLGAHYILAVSSGGLVVMHAMPHHSFSISVPAHGPGPGHMRSDEA
jgi:hypothetical protein